MTDVAQFPVQAPTTEWTQFEKTWKRPQPPPTATIEEIRDAANARSAKLFADVLGLPTSGLSVTDLLIPTTDGQHIPARLYKPDRNDKDQLQHPPTPFPLYISLQGGGFHLGSIETEDPHCRQVALATGAAVLNVDYRHTPRWTFPAPVDDAWAAFRWAVDGPSAQHGLDPDRVFIGGVSAGACLAIGVALRALSQTHGGLDGPRVRGLILGTPSTVHPDHFPSHLVHGPRSLDLYADAPFINLARLQGFLAMYKPEPLHPLCSPLLVPAGEFAGLCPVSFHIAGLDPLRDEGLLMEEKLRSVGVETTVHDYPGVPHAFMSLPTLPSAERWRLGMQEDLRRWIRSIE
ncbi:Alpha/Beta hydrolase protein [Plectosphaerella plurivora]|uniref:Alpha/Beta hydrolase protein n=1 Tax=Plectosphaerella plurivora TaxID=936078 RepID=A0A9P9A7A1_9PEZI|nr:Alpha/Beta hydrolase protein [Plectosphaerella plurivora]